MDRTVKPGRAETAAHTGLKRLALLWAQARGYTACAAEVSLPSCRYRVDLAAYRSDHGSGSTAVFECKQAWPDLLRDNCRLDATRQRLALVHARRQLLEKHLRVHYPNRRIADSLFADFDSYDFTAIGHRGYTRVVQEIATLQNRLHNCAKFEDLVRLRCANLHYLVVTNELFRETDVPLGWGALVEINGQLALARKPAWYEITSENRLALLQRIASCATRALNRELGISYDDIFAARGRSC
ncbi:MAG TPA: hypothetical protein VE758_04915 [Chthoniobacterales bacterium]|jgi:hypothetical protein|nr:hypothetical protein [Chthoniobacterales bacterium]